MDKIFKYRYLITLAAFIPGALADYLSDGRHFLFYLLSILAASIVLPTFQALLFAFAVGLFSLAFVPENHHFSFKLVIVVRMSFFMLTAALTNLLVQKQNASRDKLIRQLTSNLDLNKTLANLVLSDSKTAVEVVDSEGRIVKWNTKAAELTGFAGAEGQLHQDLFGGSPETGQNLILKTLASGQEYLDQELTLPKRGKETVIALVNTYVLRSQGVTLGAVAIYRDITEKKRLERQVQQAEKFAALTQMAAGLAHEIRNPLTTVKGFLQLMNAPSPKYLEYRELMLDEVERTNKIVSEFILLATPSAPVFKRVRLEPLIQDVIHSQRNRAELNHVIVNCSVPKMSSLFLDREQCRHLLCCLVENSIDAMPAGGVLGILAREDSEMIHIDVTDTGTGIPREIIDKIFDPFFTTKETGSGLGLSICYNIARNHHGTIRVSSTPGAGTIFTVSFPLQEPH